MTTCIACEGFPSTENNPCGLCGTTASNEDGLKLFGYIQPSDVPLFSRAEKVYVVDEEGFDGCTVAVYIKEKSK